VRQPFTLLWRLLTRHLGWKLLALLVAVALWAVVSSEPELSTFASVPLQYKDLPADLEISSPLVDSVYLELRGPSGDLRGFGDGRRLAVILDMSSVRAGQRTFTIEESNVRLPRGLQVVRAIPSQVRFDFEPRLARAVPVEARFSEPPPGYAIAGYQVSPPALRILGPASRVERISSVRTDLIDLSRAVGATSFRVGALAPDSYVRFESSPQVSVRVVLTRK
jgi:YbbR domain-containing protein